MQIKKINSFALPVLPAVKQFTKICNTKTTTLNFTVFKKSSVKELFQSKKG